MRKVAETSDNAAEISAPLAAGDPEAAFAQIAAYLESDHAKARLTTHAQREALWHLAAMPFEVSTVREACKVVAAVLAMLDRCPAELVVDAFEASVHTRPTVRP